MTSPVVLRRNTGYFDYNRVWQPRGPAVLTIPTPDVVIPAGTNIQLVVDANSPGTWYELGAGIHRMQQIMPQPGDRFTGINGSTILNGAEILAGWTDAGATWTSGTSPVVDQTGQYPGVCSSGGTECQYPEELFIDNVLQTRVLDVGDVVAGTWFLDYATDTAHLPSNPGASLVEMSYTRYAFISSEDNVVLEKLTVEKYASWAQEGAIQLLDPTAARNWTIEHCNVTQCHGMGIRFGHETKLISSRIHHMGQLGIGGGGENHLVENCEIDNNNQSGFSAGWEGGAMKFATNARGLVVRSCHIHDNNGPGIWNDGDGINCLYENNQIHGNQTAGIFHEISDSAIIRNNYIRDDAIGAGSSPQGFDGAAIFIQNSRNVEVYNNTVVNCEHGIVGVRTDRGPSNRFGYERKVMNLDVHDNFIEQSSGVLSGIANGVANDLVYTSENNDFQNNTYYVPDTTSNWHNWQGGLQTPATWQANGLDTAGVWDTSGVAEKPLVGAVYILVETRWHDPGGSGDGTLATNADPDLHRRLDEMLRPPAMQMSEVVCMSANPAVTQYVHDTELRFNTGVCPGKRLVRGDRALPGSVNDSTTHIDPTKWRAVYTGEFAQQWWVGANGGGPIELRDLQFVQSSTTGSPRFIQSGTDGTHDSYELQIVRCRRAGRGQFCETRQAIQLYCENVIAGPFFGTGSTFFLYNVDSVHNRVRAINCVLADFAQIVEANSTSANLQPIVLVNTVSDNGAATIDSVPAGSTIQNNSSNDATVQGTNGIAYTSLDFSDPDNMDFSLASQSATVVDAGVGRNSYGIVPVTDIALNPRRVTGATTIGIWRADAEGLVLPRIDRAQPASGALGNEVTLTGFGFTGTTSVTLRGTSASFVVDSDIQIRATTPDAGVGGEAEWQVTTPNGVSNTLSWSYIPTAPDIVTIAPPSGPPGQDVIITLST